MPASTPALRRILLATVALFLLLTGLRLHGFSLPFWHQVIDRSEASEVLWGEPRLIRGDDWPGGDESVGGLVRRRLGPRIRERLVDPLIGSIYAGRTEALDLHLVAPQLETAARRNRSLIRGLRS